MIKSSIEKLVDRYRMDDVAQSELINGLCKGLENSIIEKSKLDIQLCYISEKLNSKSERILKALVEFIDLKNK